MGIRLGLVFASALLLTSCGPARDASEAQASVSAETLLSSTPETNQDEGERVFQKLCVICHGLGVAGAPKAGDSEAWAARIDQGMETLVEHALLGFQGEQGVMPPRGGDMSLSDAEVEAAVSYMVEVSR
ncbi:c-type cytochrome [Desulfuromonas sp.]|uniref:c-type cytochrome n=1 Tax=Desulfuromonas sp. TaxID=892 RepID=UPI0025C42B6E|nr:c-type cytochrome [Desulfuromonas sp.]